MRKIALALLVLIGVASVITRPRVSDRASAPLLAGARIDPQLLATMKRACSDCHSEVTRYPWYSYVAPWSWLIQHDVTEGREHLDFSRWSEYSTVRRERLLSEIANQVKDGGMPLPAYTLLHRDARLSESEIDAIFHWTQIERARLIEESLSK